MNLNLAALTIGLTAIVSQPSWSSEAQTQSVSDTPFERLFTTPAQRKALDEQRRHGVIKPIITGSNDNEPITTAQSQVAAAPQQVKLMGILLRADGQNKVWMSGQETSKHQPTQTILGNGTQSANLQVPVQGISNGTILKPGQVWLPSNKRTQESYLLPVPKPIVVEAKVEEKVADSKSVESNQSSSQNTSSAVTVSSTVAGVQSSVQSSKK